MHINCDIYTSKKELHTLVTDLETTYDYLAESDMNTDDEGDTKHLRTVKTALDVLTEILNENGQ